MSADQWYYSQDNQPQGPVSFERLRELVAIESLAPSDLVWNQGMESWSEVRAVDGLLQRRMAAPTDLPPPSSSAVLSLPYGGDLAPASVSEAARSAPEPDRRQDPITPEVVRHVAFTLFAGGIADWLLFHPLIMPAAAGETARLLWAIGAYVIATLVMAFPAGRWIYGRWPLAEPLGQLLGERLSVRRHVILTSLVGALSYWILLAPAPGSGPVFQSGKVVAVAILHLFLCLAAAYMVVGFWLHGRWPLIREALDGLPAGVRDYLKYRPLNPKERHLFSSVALGLVLPFGAPIFAIVVNSLAAPSTEPVAAGGLIVTDLRSAVWAWIICSVIAYFPVGYWLNGTWPFAPVLVSILGEERSTRRRLILSLVLTAPYLGWILINLPIDSVVLVSILPAFPVFGVVYYMMGWTTHWTKTETEAHHVLSRLREMVPEVRSAICKRMADRKLPHLDQKEVTISGPGLYPMSFLEIDITHTEQIQITHGTARVILRVLEFGEDLYVRWESFFDMSGRRLRLLINLISTIVRDLVYRWTGAELTDVMETLMNILLPWRKLDTTGEQLRDTAPFATLSSRIKIPSHLLDNMFALEEALNETAEEVLNEVSVASGREEKVELLINRTRQQARAQMF